MLTILILGEPGSGKTTLANALTNQWTELDQQLDPVKHINYNTPHGPAIQLGWSKPPFGGTDTLGNTAINPIADWFPTITANIVLAEGDRLANDRFIKLAQTHGKTLIFHLTTDPRTAQERRIHRARQNNLPTQNPNWIKGRATKHNNLAQKHNAITISDKITLASQTALIEWNIQQVLSNKAG